MSCYGAFIAEVICEGMYVNFPYICRKFKRNEKIYVGKIIKIKNFVMREGIKFK